METNTLAIIEGKEYRLPETEEEYLKIERMEDEEIYKELTGELSSIYVYSFEQGGTRITDISAKGVDAMALGYGSIKCELVSLSTDGPDYIAVVSATDKIRDLTFIGSFAEPKKRANGQENKFACTNATRKAQRNACKLLFPMPLKQKVILRSLANQAEVQLIALQEGVKQRIKEYRFDFGKFDEYCVKYFGTSFLELDLEKATRAGSFVVTSQAKQALKKGE